MLAGTISWLGGCALWATSIEYCRRKFFELFYKTHIIGLITFFLFGYMHHVSLWAYTMPGMSLSKCCSEDFNGDSQAANIPVGCVLVVLIAVTESCCAQQTDGGESYAVG